MSLIKYLEDKVSVVILYVCMLSVINIFLFLTNEVSDKTIININVYTFIILIIYFSVDYYLTNRRINIIKKYLELEIDKLMAMSNNNINNEYEVFKSVISEITNKYINEIEKHKLKNSEYQDYLIKLVHEIKIPITTINLLLSNNNQFSYEELSLKINSELNAISEYVEQVLFYGRVDSFNNDYYIEEVDVNLVIKERLKHFSKLFISRKINLEFNDEKLFMFSDYKWLTYIISQVLSNSLKYSNEGGIITINLYEDDTYKYIEISDTGVGVLEEDINRVFYWNE